MNRRLWLGLAIAAVSLVLVAQASGAADLFIKKQGSELRKGELFLRNDNYTNNYPSAPGLVSKNHSQEKNASVYFSMLDPVSKKISKGQTAGVLEKQKNMSAFMKKENAKVKKSKSENAKSIRADIQAKMQPFMKFVKTPSKTTALDKTQARKLYIERQN